MTDFTSYVGLASPMDFNGLVRHYYLRRGSNVADIQVNLLPKQDRKLQSHAIAKQVRQRLLPIAERYGARIKVAEVPPGPPVLQTLVAEVYGPRQDERLNIAKQIRDLWKRTDGVVDVDWYVEDDQPKYRLVVDKEKAALNGISEDDIARTMQLASGGYQARKPAGARPRLHAGWRSARQWSGPRASGSWRWRGCPGGSTPWLPPRCRNR